MRHLYKFVILVLILFSNSLHAAQSNFQISPPPIASPEFKEGDVDRKMSATYVGISGSGFSLNGGGVNFVTRKANSDTTAVDFASGIFILGGSMDMSGSSSSLMSMSVPLSVNFEYQAVKNDSTDVILFGGPMMNLGLSTFSFTTPYTYIYYTYQTIGGISFSVPNTSTVSNTTNVSTTTLLYGGQVGAQASIKSGDYIYSPFVMLQSQQGSASSTMNPTFGSSSSSTIDLPNFTSTSYGFDILYRPMNITLSSMLQVVTGGGSSNSGFQTTIISLGWKF